MIIYNIHTESDLSGVGFQYSDDVEVIESDYFQQIEAARPVILEADVLFLKGVADARGYIEIGIGLALNKKIIILEDPFIKHTSIDPQLMIKGTTIQKMTIQEFSDWTDQVN